MADMQPVNVPKPPISPNVNELHKWANDLHVFISQNMGAGLQTTFLSTDQLSNVTDKEHTGKLFYNNDTGTLHATVIDSGNLVVKQVTLT